VKRCVPCHWGTFPALTGTPDELDKLAPAGVQIEKIQPGDSVTL
jgi:L-ascorbate metabolism protein UlaG (beta-lactamase superfamily)